MKTKLDAAPEFTNDAKQNAKVRALITSLTEPFSVPILMPQRLPCLYQHGFCTRRPEPVSDYTPRGPNMKWATKGNNVDLRSSGLLLPLQGAS